MMKPEKLDLVSEWDKTFPKSKSVNHKKGHFCQSLRYHPCR